MQYLNIANGPAHASSIILGCMRMPALSVKNAAHMINAAWQEGVDYFDHATCYGDGEAETRFGDAVSGNRPAAGRRDFAKQMRASL